MEKELEYLDLDIDEENSGSVRRLEEGFTAFKESWLLGFNANRYRYGTWIMTIHFDPFMTNGPSNPGGKLSVTIYGIETRTILSFKNATKPGNFYIKNFAYAPNASGHGGGAFKYATSELNDLGRNFVNSGIEGIVDSFKERFIPQAIENHIETAHKYQRLAKNPEQLIKNYSIQGRKQLEKSLGLTKFFKTTKEVFGIGINIGEAIVTPEVFATKSIRKLGTSISKKITLSSKKTFIKKVL